ncbi:hypothetical protein, partial [Leucobacter sp. M11]|uniref:hypothetical protein n=1 Tax=Leucobacter sp. M11 TaxID=2993565 RepID=UPI002D8FC6C9|nr:sensor histidine kinase [Leucobacter sp. M11]
MNRKPGHPHPPPAAPAAGSAAPGTPDAHQPHTAAVEHAETITVPLTFAGLQHALDTLLTVTA